VQEALETLMKGRTSFVIAHRLSTIRNADKIYVIENGQVAEQGKHDELLNISGGIYANLVELQMKS
jgi:ABC-type multidrug transport system fused ATPase/permease subunit